MVADPDLARTYKDYLLGSVYQLTRPSEGERRAAGKVLYRDRRARKALVTMDQTPEAGAGLSTFRRAPRPLTAAVLTGLIDHPQVLQERAELLAGQGLGDPALDRLVSDLVRLTWDIADFGDGLLRARLVALGHDETLKAVDRTARISHAPFLDAAQPAEQARADLTRAIDALLAALALNRALDDLKTEADFDGQAFVTLKAERDAQDRILSSGGLWVADETVH
jgi:DNA primase